MRGALQRGDIFFHAFPHDGQASAFPDASLFDAALGVARALSRELGLPPSTAVSQRDVPGWTRATVPLLARRARPPIRNPIRTGSQRHRGAAMELWGARVRGKRAFHRSSQG